MNKNSNKYDERYIVGSMIPDDMEGFQKKNLIKVLSAENNLLKEKLPDIVFVQLKIILS